MENSNIVLLKHHFVNFQDVKNTAFYRNQCPDIDDRIIIDVTSRVVRDKEFLKEHPNFPKEISPMYAGPVHTPDGMISNTFEHFWQPSKVYPCFVKDGKVLPEFFEWRNKWFTKTEVGNKKDSRYPCQELGYQNSDALFTMGYENGEYVPMPYLLARKKMYFPIYAALIAGTESYRWIKSLIDSGKKIALLDFDGYNYDSEEAMRKQYVSYLNKCKREKVEPKYDESDFLKIKCVKDVVNCPFLLAGHGFAIKMLLQGDIVVNEDGTVTDITGVLAD